MKMSDIFGIASSNVKLWKNRFISLSGKSSNNQGSVRTATCSYFEEWGIWLIKGQTKFSDSKADITDYYYLLQCNAITCSCVSEDRRWIATADSGKDSMVIIWDSFTT